MIRSAKAWVGALNFRPKDYFIPGAAPAYCTNISPSTILDLWQATMEHCRLLASVCTRVCEVSLLELLTFDVIPRLFFYELAYGKDDRSSLRAAFHMMHSAPMPEAIHNGCSNTNWVRLVGSIFC